MDSNAELRNRHEIQMHILTKLQFSDGLRYTEMKPEGMFENNQFQYHLDKLLEEKLISKDEGKYKLTTKGKTFANSIVSEKKELVKPQKVSVRLICLRGEGEDMEAIVYTRLKHPFYGVQGFFTGKLDYGELLDVAAKREMKEETNLDGEVKLVSIDRFLVRIKDTGDLVEDKFFYNYVSFDPVGEILSNDEGKYEWMKVSEFEDKITNPVEGIDVIKDLVREAIENSKTGNITVRDQIHETEKF